MRSCDGSHADGGPQFWQSPWPHRAMPNSAKAVPACGLGAASRPLCRRQQNPPDRNDHGPLRWALTATGVGGLVTRAGERRFFQQQREPKPRGTRLLPTRPRRPQRGCSRRSSSSGSHSGAPGPSSAGGQPAPPVTAAQVSLCPRGNRFAAGAVTARLGRTRIRWVRLTRCPQGKPRSRRRWRNRR